MTDEELDRQYDAAYFCAMQPSEGSLQHPGTYTSGHASSASWCTKTPADILADVNVLLATYRWLANLNRRDRVKHLLNSRRTRRPEKFTVQA